MAKRCDRALRKPRPINRKDSPAGYLLAETLTDRIFGKLIPQAHPVSPAAIRTDKSCQLNRSMQHHLI